MNLSILLSALMLTFCVGGLSGRAWSAPPETESVAHLSVIPNADTEDTGDTEEPDKHSSSPAETQKYLQEIRAKVEEFERMLTGGQSGRIVLVNASRDPLNKRVHDALDTRDKILHELGTGKYHRKKYKKGGIGMDAFDCSGFVWRVIKEALNFTPPNLSSAQLWAAAISGKKYIEVDGEVEPNYLTEVVRNPQPGDLVFFGEPVTHVGFFIGTTYNATDEKIRVFDARGQKYGGVVDTPRPNRGIAGFAKIVPPSSTAPQQAPTKRL